MESAGSFGTESEGSRVRDKSEQPNWIQRDISDRELDIIMNRDLLFDINSELFTGHLDGSGAQTDTDTSSSLGTSLTTSDDEPAANADSTPIPSSSSAESEEEQQCELPVAVKVRVEGDMYDIITTSADEIFSAIH